LPLSTENVDKTTMYSCLLTQMM